MAGPGFGAPRYYDEYLGPVTFGPFAAELVALVPEIAAGTVLEVACGTGVLTAPLRRRLPAAVDLVATDLSAPMLEYARTRLGAQEGIAWQTADMTVLPFADGRFAAAICGFGVMFPPDRAAALREIRRVLADGAPFVFSVWDAIERNPHALAIAQVLEGLFPGDPDMRFRTPYEMADPQALRSLLAAAGFDAVEIATRRLPIAGADPRKVAAGTVLGTPRAALIAQRGLDPQEVVAQAAAALVRVGGDPFHAHAQALLVRTRAA